MRASGSPVHTSRITRSAAAAISGVDRPSRNNRASPTYRDSLRARPGNPAATRNNPLSARPLTSAPPRTPPSVRRRQSHGEAPQRARGRQSHGERRPQSDEHNRARASTSTVSHTARLAARPSRREALQDPNISAGAASSDPHTQSLPRWHSVSAQAHSHDSTVLREEQHNPMPRLRLQSESPRAHSQNDQIQSLPGRHSTSAGAGSQDEHASFEEEIGNSLMSISAGLHSLDERSTASDEIRSAVLRPPRRFVMQPVESNSLLLHAPAPVLECTLSEDSIQNQTESGQACNLGSQTGNSSTSNRCHSCTQPRPCEHHDPTLEDAMYVPRNTDSPHVVADTMAATSVSRSSPTRIAGSEISGMAATSGNRSSPTRIAGSEISGVAATSGSYSSRTRIVGSEVSGMYRRPRRERSSRVEDESVVPNLAAPGYDYNPNTHRTEAQENILQSYNASASDSIGLRNESILNGLRQTARASVANDDHIERSENGPPVPDVAASGSRRSAKGRKKIQSRNTKPETSGEKACSSLDSSPVDDCPICLAPLVGKCGKTRCGHNFHIDCLEQHLLVTAVDRPTCPICRGELRLKLPVSAEATSGNPMEVLHRVPPEESRCHLDRGYTFLSLGSFAERPRMLYVRTSNEDKWTPANAVMWTLTASVPITVYLNFRSIEHVTETGAMKWLRRGSWAPSDLESTVSTGWPNGPYEGPVFAKDFEPGKIELMGSNCHEGTYFVFVELRNKSEFDALPWDLSQILE